MAEILHQLIGSLSHDLQGFINSRWLFGISSINSSMAIFAFRGQFPSVFAVGNPRMPKVPESGECCGCANWTETLGIPVPDGGAGEATFSVENLFRDSLMEVYKSRTSAK